MVDNSEIASGNGIKLTSCLNESIYFYAAEGLPPDLALDVLEGIVVDVIFDILGVLVENKISDYKSSIT